MPYSPRVSIICLCYNHEDFVVDSLNSVINQDYKNTELIIVDDHSSDRSADIIAKWNAEKGFLFIKNPANLGNTKSFNIGLAKATGDFIIDLAADDILLPKFISSHVKTFQESQFDNLGVVYSNAEMIDKNGRHIKYHYPIDETGRVYEKPPSGDVYASLLERYYINSPSMMTSKAVFERLGGYDEHLLYEDLDFWIRSSRWFDYDFTDQVLVQKRILPDSHGKQFYKKKGKKLSESTLIICKKAFDLNQNRKEYKALCNRLKYETKLGLKVGHYLLAFKFLRLYLKSKFRSLF
jgi:glycosyltransferase involved in cell wall biosynthesis